MRDAEPRGNDLDAFRAGLCAAVAVAAVVSPPKAGQLMLWWGLFTAWFTFGVPPLAGALCLIGGAVSRRRSAPWLTVIGLWIAVTVLVPGHALAVYLQGEGPIIC